MLASDEQVSQFMSVTGSADPQQATQYLEMSGGSLETAVGLYMEHNGAGMGGGGAMPRGGGAGGAGGLGLGDDGNFAAAMSPQVRAPDATRTMRLMDDVDVGPHRAYQLMNAMMEEQLAQSTFASSPIARRDPRAAVNAAAAESKDDDDTGEEGKENYDDDDEDDDLHAASSSAPPAPARLADMFAPPDHLMHKAGGFQGARTAAKDSRRWLLVNLQRDSEFSCHAMNRDVWRDELVENLVREGFIFWQAWDVSNEGRTYSERYQVLEYPHLAIIDPRTGRLMWRKEGWTQQNPMTAESFAEIAMDFCSRNSFDRPPTAPRPPIGAAASRPSKRPMHAMSEDEQLQAAMRASLESSSQDHDDPMQDGDDDDVEELGTSASDDAKQPAATETIATVENLRSGSSFLDELVALDIGEEPPAGARIQFRMPDGKRIIRKFAESDSVKSVYAFVAQSSQEASSGREFTMMAGFPPRDLLADIENTVESCKLAGETITVRSK